MIINIIGRSPGYESGLTAQGARWGINNFDVNLTALFDLHPDGFNEPHQTRERDKANAMGIPIYRLDTINAKLMIDSYDTDYFGSSVDWMIAYAIMVGASEIHLWGIAMDDKADHYHKRCSTDFWCGYAKGSGVEVVIHGNSTVMTTKDGKTYGLYTPMQRQYKINSCNV